MKFLSEMTYRDNNVCQEGPTVIEGVEHYVIGGYVRCNRSLNHKAWGITVKESECRECYKERYQVAAPLVESVPVGFQFQMF